MNDTPNSIRVSKTAKKNRSWLELPASVLQLNALATGIYERPLA